MRIIVACILAVGLYPILGKANKPMYTPATVVEILKVTNLGEIELANMAKEKSSNKDVEQFAEDMQTDHNQNLEKLRNLVSAKKYDSLESDRSRDMKMRNDAKHDQLDVLQGRSFDKAYIDTMVSAHQDVLNTLDAELIPSTKDAELRALLLKTKEKVNMHLKHAQRIQDSFSRQ